MSALRTHALIFSRYFIKQCPSTSCCPRFLFSGEILGMDSFKRQHVMVSDRLGNTRGSFVSRMQSEVSAEGRRIFTEDIKSMLFLAETKDEVDTLISMIRKHLNNQPEDEYGLSRFQLGPALCRLLHITKQSDLALSLYTDPALSNVFTHITTHLLLMDLMYENQRYDAVVELYASLRTKLGDGFRYPIDCTTLLLAALYRQNTEEALKHSIEVIKDANSKYLMVTGRALAFTASLALNQNKPEVALEVCSTVKNPRAVSILNLRSIAFARLDRLEDAIPLFREILQEDSAEFGARLFVFPETISEIQEAVEKKGSVDIRGEFQSIKESLHNSALIRSDSLKEFIEETIFHQKTQQRDGFDSRNPRDSFKNRRRAPVDGARSRGPGFRPGYNKRYNDEGQY